MHKFCLQAIFLGLVICAQAQNNIPVPPLSDERAVRIEQLSTCFLVAKEPEVVPDTIDMWRRWNTVNNYTFGKNRGDLPMIADLSALHPYFRDKVVELIQVCHSKGIELAVVETYRTVAKQNEYRKLGKIYTRSSGGRSKHQYGLAIDIVPMIDSVAQWDNIALWKKVGVVGEKLGLRWGGRWRHPYDPGHFEWSGGVSAAAMEQGANPRIPHPEKYPCLSDDLDILHQFWAKWEDEQRGKPLANATEIKSGTRTTQQKK